MVTKWDVLVERRNEAQKKADQLQKDLEGLRKTYCGLNCAGCGKFLATEMDFAQHFTIPDIRYLNLGRCPLAEADEKKEA
jgi:hypothetical protein